MPGCDFTRRDLLRWTAYAAAATPLALTATPAFGATASAGSTGTVTPVDLELVTLAENHAVITWFTGVAGTNDGIGQMTPAIADGEVRYGTRPDKLNKLAHDITHQTPYHHVELTDLEPGQTYYYQALSNGVAAQPTPFNLIAGNSVGTSTFGMTTGGPYSFTTPQPPQGRHLFTVILCNDLHMGETQAGLVGGLPFVGIQQEPGLPPYPEVMLEALVHDASALDASFLLAAGDISAEAVPIDLSKAGQLLTKIIQTMGLSRQTVYIGNILKCRPDMPNQASGNRKPTPEEMQTCIPYLHQQIDLIRPKVIVALGATAVDGLLGKTIGITKLRGNWRTYRGTPLMPTYHPAYLLRNQALSEKRRVWEDMLQVMEKLALPISEKQRNYFLKS